MLLGVALPGTAVVNGTSVTGAQVLRTNTTTRAQLANGNYGAFLTSLNTTLNYSGNPSSDRGAILRRAGYPENFLVPDPQYSSATIQGNNQNSTFHALNLQFTRRLSNGIATTGTYIWSKTLGAGTVVDPNNRNESKALQSIDHRHQISANGTYELPFGPNHFLLGAAPGWAQRIVEKWQLGGIFNFITGPPVSITSGLSTISGANSRPSAAGPIPSGLGQLKKCSTADPCYAGTSSPVTSGVVYFDGYTQVNDPGLSSACNGLSSAYTNKAIADPKGNIILVNPQPGQIGTLGYTTVTGPRAMYFDMDLIKRIRVTETKSLEFRLDAINLFNHPNFAAPSSSINGNNNFGRVTSLLSGVNLGGNGGMRSFIVNARVNF
jgi:hypothetical protein